MENTKSALEILNGVSKEDSTWKEKAEARKDNRQNNQNGGKIAFKILETLRRNSLSGNSPSSEIELHNFTGISIEEINLILKGRTPLSEEVQIKIENALNIKL